LPHKKGPSSLGSLKRISKKKANTMLFRTLPGDKEAELMNLMGTVEEIHLPAGGIIKECSHILVVFFL
jgi:hypothetical protein